MAVEDTGEKPAGWHHSCKAHRSRRGLRTASPRGLRGGLWDTPHNTGERPEKAGSVSHLQPAPLETEHYKSWR